MYISELRIRNFRCFGDEMVSIPLEGELTAFVGTNGSGKTSVLYALQRLFGASSTDRAITRQDVHFGTNEEAGHEIDNSATDSTEDTNISEERTPEVEKIYVPNREIVIEAILSFPELAENSGADLGGAIEMFQSMSCSDVGAPLQARIRLEAKWEFGRDEDDIEQRIYWVTTFGDVPFGSEDVSKIPMKPYHRRRIELKFLPATRDSSAIIQSALKEFLLWLEKFGDFESSREELQAHRESLQKSFESLPVVGLALQELSTVWSKLFDGNLFQSAKLSVMSKEVHKAIRELSLTLSPDASGGEHGVNELSEGQASLLYISLVSAIIKLDNKYLGKDNSSIDGIQESIDPRPWLTIIALEEPENHLAPFYLSKLISQIKEITDEQNAMGIITSHSAGAIRRVEPNQIRHVFHNETTRSSEVNKLALPPTADAEAKFIYEAVRSNPELYFAKLVILGEGRSEEIVIPKLAKAFGSGLNLDPSFIAFVPLGGRHVNHLWKLLHQLKIPHVTLLDYDLGRYHAGPYRLKYVIDQLEEQGVTLPAVKPADATAWKALDQATFQMWINFAWQNNVIFSIQLDLDMMMIEAFELKYGELADIQNSPIGPPIDCTGSVFGATVNPLSLYPNGLAPTASQLYIYDKLFKKGSKPVAHIEALASLTHAELNSNCPSQLQLLFERCNTLLNGSDADPLRDPLL